MRPKGQVPDRPAPTVPLGEDGTARCTAERRLPLYRMEQVELAPAGVVPMREIGTADLRCIHEQGHRGPHLAYHCGHRVAWPNGNG